MFKFLEKCIADRGVLWDNGLKHYPFCFLRVWSLKWICLISFNACAVALSRADAGFLQKTSTNYIFKHYRVLKIETVATKHFETVTENEEKSIFHSDRLFSKFCFQNVFRFIALVKCHKLLFRSLMYDQ